jgi:hypothetical protein
MDKKKNQDIEDLKGFEEFINEHSEEGSFLPKTPGKEVSFEHFTFLTNDADRLVKIKNLLMEKLPFTVKYDQGQRLIDGQKKEIEIAKKQLHEIFKQKGSPFLRSLSEIFDTFFSPPKN